MSLTQGDFEYYIIGGLIFPEYVSILNYTGAGGAVTIPSTLPNSSDIQREVIKIEENAFRNKGITSVNLDNGYLLRIDPYAFAENNITSVNIPDLTDYEGKTAWGSPRLGSYAFADNPNLTNVSFDVQLTSASYCFNNANLGDNGISFTNMTYVPSDMFRNSGLTSLTIPENITSLKDSCFDGNTNLTNLTLMGNIDDDTLNPRFADASLGDNVTFGGNVTSIPSYLLYRAGITSITIPESITSLGNYSLAYNENLSSFTVENRGVIYGTNVLYTNKEPDNKGIIYAEIPSDTYTWWDANLTGGYYEFTRTYTHTHSPIFRSIETEVASGGIIVGDGTPIWQDWSDVGHLLNRERTNSYPSIAVDSNGYLYACYAGTSNEFPSYYTLFLSKSTDGGTTWGKWTRILDSATVNTKPQIEPRVRVDSNDDVHIVWRGQDSANPSDYQIKYMKSTDGGDTWSSWININSVFERNQSSAEFIIDENNYLYVSYEEEQSKGSTYNNIYFAKSTDGGSTWSATLVHTASSLRNFNSDLAIDSSGNIHIVWEGQYATYPTTGYYQIKYSKSTDGGSTWSGEVLISPDSQSERYSTIRIDSSDNIHVLFSKDTPINSDEQLKHIKSTDGGSTWSSIVDISVDVGGLGTVYTSTLEIDSSNNLYAFWYTQEARVYHSKSTDGGSTWSSQVRVHSDIPFSQSLMASCLFGSEIYVVWQGRDTNYYNFNKIKYSKLDIPTSTFTDWVNIPPVSEGNQENSKIAISSDNNLHIVWSGKDSISSTPVDTILYSKSNVYGEIWNGWLNVSKIDDHPQYDPQIAIDSSDNLHIVWYGTDSATPTNSQIKYSKSTDGGDVWSDAINIQEVIGYTQATPHIAIDSNDYIYVVWEGTDATNTINPQIKYSKSIDGGSTWSSLVNISTVSGYSQSLSKTNAVTIDSSDNIHVCWYGADPSNTTNTQIKYSKSTSGGAIWSSWTNVQAISGYDQIDSCIKTDSSNNIHISWAGYDSVVSDSYYHLKYSKSVDGGSTWSSWINIQPLQFYNKSPHLEIDSSDVLHIMYDGDNDVYEGAINNLWYTSSSDGSSWSTAQMPNPIDYDDAFSTHSFVIDSNSALHVVTSRPNDEDVLTLKHIIYGVIKWEKWVELGYETATPNYQEYPNIATDSNNDIHVVWADDASTGNYQILHKKSTDNGVTWSDCTVVSSISGYDQYYARMVIDSNDDIHVVWQGRDATYSSYIVIKHSKSTDGGSTWSSWVNVASVSGYSQYTPFIVADSSNNLHVVWTGRDATHSYYQVKYSKSTDGGSTWSSWINIDPSSSYSQDMCEIGQSIAVDSNDYLYVVWAGRDSTYTTDAQIKYSKSTDGGSTWSGYVNIQPIISRLQIYPSIAIDSNNYLHVVWQGEDDVNINDYFVKYSKSVDSGGTWSSWVNVSPTQLQSQEVVIAIDSNDIIHLICDARTDTYYDYDNLYYFFSANNGITWSDPISLPSLNYADFFYYGHSLAVSSNDALHLVAVKADNYIDNNYGLKYSRYNVGDVVESATPIIVNGWDRIRRLRGRKSSSWYESKTTYRKNALWNRITL